MAPKECLWHGATVAIVLLSVRFQKNNKKFLMRKQPIWFVSHRGVHTIRLLGKLSVTGYKKYPFLDSFLLSFAVF